MKLNTLNLTPKSLNQSKSSTFPFPRMHPEDGRVVSNFIMQALQNKPITIFGDGQQSRSFCYVDDLIEALVRMMNTGDEFPGPVNIGNPSEFTMLELANTIIRFIGSSSRIEYHPLPGDDPRQRQPDISLASQKIEWEPTIQLEEGLSKTMAYFQGLAQSDCVTV